MSRYSFSPNIVIPVYKHLCSDTVGEIKAEAIRISQQVRQCMCMERGCVWVSDMLSDHSPVSFRGQFVLCCRLSELTEGVRM